MDCITHKFLFLLFVYVPIRRRISSIWSRSRHACPLCWDLGRYCPNRLPSHFGKCHRGDYQPALLISKDDENPGNMISTSKGSIHLWTNSCSWSKWKIIMYISDFRVNISTGLVTGVAAEERHALYGQEPGARHCNNSVALPTCVSSAAPQWSKQGTSRDENREWLRV